MDYKEKYKEVLRKATKIHRNDREEIKYYMEVLFPELVESEDERIRKEIIYFLSRNTFQFGEDIDKYKSWLTWLEKQGEQKAQAKSAIEAWKDMRLEVYQQASGNRHEVNYSDDTTKMFSLNDIDEIIEKISEHKSANNVEPKFKVGDWIMDKESKEVFYISKNLANTYKIVDIEGNDYHVPHYILEEDYDVWTIQDAKPGDVLVGKIDGDKYIIIFKRIKDGWVETYGHYNGTLSRFCVPSQLFCRDYQGTFTPATKEQRDILFAKMKEAGYVWDAEKKELKHYGSEKL